MTKSKNTKRALLASVLSMMLCMAMLVGSTFAWFTDSVTSGKNTIIAGNLDVELYAKNGNSGTYATVAGNDELFLKDALWEPGHVEVVNLKVANLGTLALKYQFGINVADQQNGTNVKGDSFKLSDYIMFAVIDGEQTYADRDEAIAAAEATAVKLSEYATNGNGVLYPTAKATTENPAEKYVTLIAYMPTTVGNEANYKTGTPAPTIELGVNLVATQTPLEKDSFNENYDVNAPVDFMPVSNADELADAVAKGKNIVLNNDIEITKLLDFSKSVTISGNGNTISRENGNCIISAQNITDDITITLQNVDLNAGSIERCVSIYNNANFNLVLDNCSAAANYYAINVANGNPNVNLTIKNSEVTGWCAFQTWSEGTKATFENCTLIGNNTFPYVASGDNDFATIVINTDAPNTELSFSNCRFEANQTTGNKQYLLSVRAPGAKITIDNCSYYADGAEIENLGQYVSIYQAAADLQLTIDGNIIPIN